MRYEERIRQRVTGQRSTWSVSDAFLVALLLEYRADQCVRVVHAFLRHVRQVDDHALLHEFADVIGPIIGQAQAVHLSRRIVGVVRLVVGLDRFDKRRLSTQDRAILIPLKSKEHALTGRHSLDSIGSL